MTTSRRWHRYSVTDQVSGSGRTRNSADSMAATAVAASAGIATITAVASGIDSDTYRMSQDGHRWCSSGSGGIESDISLDWPGEPRLRNGAVGGNADAVLGFLDGSVTQGACA